MGGLPVRHLGSEAVLILDGEEIPLVGGVVVERPMLADVLAMRDRLAAENQLRPGGTIPWGDTTITFDAKGEAVVPVHPDLQGMFDAGFSAEFTMDLTPEAARRFTAFCRKATRKSAPRAMVQRFESWREAARRTRRASKRWRGDALR